MRLGGFVHPWECSHDLATSARLLDHGRACAAGQAIDPLPVVRRLSEYLRLAEDNVSITD
ncbi:hypothetical protein [Nitrosomonas halophila]|uniref:Uncharacterized protein n=1 Tax=Nitrosomonas halophila TaxID=44576 RepID=A0A1H3P0T7_9PROT|nr:hypothetical protein [Nitrosomonas halophila]SDY94039.1 hypothetical protein SAMN05421881_10845 [Nitrosomonas halophila]